jgi:competence protein ComEC
VERERKAPPPRSPLVGLAAVFAVGVALARWLGPRSAWALALLLAATGALVLFGGRRPRLALGLSLVIALAAGGGLSAASLARWQGLEARIGALRGSVPLTVRVVGDVDRDERRDRAWVEVFDAPAELRDLLGARLSLGVYGAGNPAFSPGDLLRGDFRLDGIGEPENPLSPDYGEYLRAHRIAGWARDAGGLEVTGALHDPTTLFLRLREWLHERIQDHLHPQARPLALALLTGDRGDLTPTDLERFRDAGIFHILAVSGLHVGIVGYLAFMLGGALPLKRRGRYLLALAVVVGFTFLTGARAPALRACLMAGLYLGGRILGRPAHLGTSVAGAALVLLVINPLSLWDLSFQLSFAAAAGIAALTPTLSAWLARRRVPEPLADGLAAPVAAQLALFPLLALHFAQVPVLAFALNVVVVPLVGVALALGVPYLLLAAAAVPAATEVFGTLVSLVLRLVDWLTGAASRVPLMTTGVRQPAVWLVLFTLALLGAAWWLWRRGKKRWGPVVPAALVVLLWGWHLLREDLPNRLRITFFSVDRGDTIFIESPTGDRVVVDGGMDAAEPLVEYLRRRGVTEVDAVFLSHPNADHCSGLTPLLHRFEVGRVYRPPDLLPTGEFTRYLLAERLSGAEVRLPAFGEKIPLRDGRLELTVLSDSDRPYTGAEINDASLVLLLRYGEFEALFTGDLEGAGERRLLERWEPETVDLLKVAHHGSATSSTEAFLRAAGPGHGVVFPDRGLLAEEVRRRLAESGCWLYDVGERGACVVETDGRVFSLGRFDGSFAPAVALAGD